MDRAIRLALCLAHVAAGIALCLTIIGIPFGIAAFKLSVLALVPLGVRIVDVDSVQPLPQGAAWSPSSPVQYR